MNDESIDINLSFINTDYFSVSLRDGSISVIGRITKLELEIAKEIGDVLWYCATLSHDIGFKLSDIGKMNYEKLHSRQLRGKLHGSGDNR